MVHTVTLKWSALIVLINAALGALFTVALTYNTVSQIYPGNTSEHFVMCAVLFAIGIIASLGVWVIVAGVFHLFSELFGGDGTFKSTLTATGIGFAPSIAYTLIYIFSMRDVFSIQVAGDATEVARAVGDAFRNSPYVLSNQILSLVCLAGMTIIWTVGIKDARKLSSRAAVLVVCLPVGVYAAYTVYGMI